MKSIGGPTDRPALCQTAFYHYERLGLFLFLNRRYDNVILNLFFGPTIRGDDIENRLIDELFSAE